MKIEITPEGKDGLFCAGLYFVLYLVVYLIFCAIGNQPNKGFWLAAIALVAYDAGKGRGGNVTGFTITKN